MRFNFILLFISFVLLGTSAKSVQAAEVVILDYHTFLGNSSSTLDFSPAAVGEQLDQLAKLGYRFVSLQDAVSGKLEGNANLVVTIDDGNHTVFPAFKDVFEPRGIKPFLFIYPGVISRVKYALTVEQLRELAADGCSIGAHGFFHEYMSSKAFKENPDKVLIEVNRPGPALGKMLEGTPPTFFAYPFGVAAPEMGDLLQKAGYSFAFLADDKLKPVDFSDPALPHYFVPRTIVYHWNFATIYKQLEARLKEVPAPKN